MNQTKRNPFLYVGIALVIVIVLAAVIYFVLSTNKTAPSATSTIVLTPEQAAQKAAIIQRVMNQQPVTLSPAQAKAKAAIIEKLQNQKPL